MEKLVLVAVAVSLLLAGCTSQANPSVTPAPSAIASSPTATTGVVSSTVPSASPDQVLFEERAGWGPCPSVEGCWKNTYLYYSGKFISEASGGNFTKQLTVQEFQAILSKIRATRIMQKECRHGEVVDYWASYSLNLDGESRRIAFPGCEDEITSITALFPKTPSALPSHGGA